MFWASGARVSAESLGAAGASIPASFLHNYRFHLPPPPHARPRGLSGCRDTNCSWLCSRSFVPAQVACGLVCASGGASLAPLLKPTADSKHCTRHAHNAAATSAPRWTAASPPSCACPEPSRPSSMPSHHKHHQHPRQHHCQHRPSGLRAATSASTPAPTTPRWIAPTIVQRRRCPMRPTRLARQANTLAPWRMLSRAAPLDHQKYTRLARQWT